MPSEFERALAEVLDEKMPPVAPVGALQRVPAAARAVALSPEEERASLHSETSPQNLADWRSAIERAPEGPSRQALERGYQQTISRAQTVAGATSFEDQLKQMLAEPEPEAAAAPARTGPEPSLWEDIKIAGGALPAAVKSAYASFIQGGDPETMFKDTGWKRAAIEESRRLSEEAATTPGAEEDLVDFLGIKLTRRDVRTAPQNLAFSLVSLGSSLLGAIAGSPLGRGGQAVGAGAGGAAAAYRMSANQFMHDFRTAMDVAAQQQVGRKLTDDEFIAIAKSPEMQDAAKQYGLTIAGKGSAQELARAYGLHEAAWEALGNVIMLGAGKYIVGQAIKGKIIKPIAVGLGAAAGEVATEVPTQIGQQQQEVRAGIQEGPERSFLEARDYVESFKEVAGPTLLTTLLLGGGAGAVGVTGRALRREQAAEPSAEEPPPSAPGPQVAPELMTHRLDDGTAVRPLVEKGKPLEGWWEDAQGRTHEATRADPIRRPVPNSTVTIGGVEYEMEVVGKGRKEGTARLLDGQEFPITQFTELDDTAKTLLGMAVEKPTTAAAARPPEGVQPPAAAAPTPAPAAAPEAAAAPVAAPAPTEAPAPAAAPPAEPTSPPPGVFSNLPDAQAEQRRLEDESGVKHRIAMSKAVAGGWQVSPILEITGKPVEKAGEKGGPSIGALRGYLDASPPENMLTEAVRNKVAEIEQKTRETRQKIAKGRTKVDTAKDSAALVAAKMGGINVSHRLDITGEDKGNMMLPFGGPLFTKNGLGLDDLALFLHERGYLTDQEFNSVDGGVDRVIEMISDEFRGRRKHFALNVERRREEEDRDRAGRAEMAQREREEREERRNLEREAARAPEEGTAVDILEELARMEEAGTAPAGTVERIAVETQDASYEAFLARAKEVYDELRSQQDERAAARPVREEAGRAPARPGEAPPRAAPREPRPGERPGPAERPERAPEAGEPPEVRQPRAEYKIVKQGWDFEKTFPRPHPESRYAENRTPAQLAAFHKTFAEEHVGYLSAQLRVARRIKASETLKTEAAAAFPGHKMTEKRLKAAKEELADLETQVQGYESEYRDAFGDAAANAFFKLLRVEANEQAAPKPEAELKLEAETEEQIREREAKEKAEKEAVEKEPKKPADKTTADQLDLFQTQFTLFQNVAPYIAAEKLYTTAQLPRDIRKDAELTIDEDYERNYGPVRWRFAEIPTKEALDIFNIEQETNEYFEQDAQELANQIKETGHFQAVVVGPSSSEGFHRVRAAEILGRNTVPAYVFVPDLFATMQRRAQYEVTDEAWKQGVEWEGRLFGGTHDARTMTAPGVKVETIYAGRQAYNRIRAAFGLPKIKDWRQRPDRLIQNEPEPSGGTEGLIGRVADIYERMQSRQLARGPALIAIKREFMGVPGILTVMKGLPPTDDQLIEAARRAYAERNAGREVRGEVEGQRGDQPLRGVPGVHAPELRYGETPERGRRGEAGLPQVKPSRELEDPAKWIARLKKKYGEGWAAQARRALEELEQTLGERPVLGETTAPGEQWRRDKTFAELTQLWNALARETGEAVPGGKGARSIAGFRIDIETLAGERRQPQWPVLQDDYGEIRGVVGKDKDYLDVFVNAGTPVDFSGTVFVVNQTKADGSFDEHKVLLGYDSLAAARRAYQRNYEAGWDRGRSIVPISMPAFKIWAADKSKTGPKGGRLTLRAVRKIEEGLREISAPEGEAALPGQAPAQRDLFGAYPIPSEVPAPEAREGALRFEHLVVEAERTGAVRLPAGKINDKFEAAQAFSQLARHPRERFQVIGLDENDRPVAYYDLFAGTIIQAPVYTREIILNIAATPGVKSVWVAHNHPSGFAEPSSFDETMDKQVSAALAATGTKLAGNLIIAGRNAIEFHNEAVPAAFRIQPVDRGWQEVPVVERMIQREEFDNRHPPLTTSDKVRSYLRETFAPTQPGILFLDASNRPLAWYPMSTSEMTQAGTGDLNLIAPLMRQISRNNAESAILVTMADRIERTVFDRIENLLQTVGMRLHDAIRLSGLEIISYRERQLIGKMGKLLTGQEQVAYEMPGKRVKGMTPEEMHDELKGSKLYKSLFGRVEIVNSAWQIPRRSFISMRSRGVYHEGRIYLVSSNNEKGDSLRVLVHEAVGHLGMDHVLRQTQSGMDVIEVFKEIYRARSRDIAREVRSGFLKQWDLNLAKENHQWVAAAEWIAVRAERGEEQALWKRVVAAIRNWLRQYQIVKEWSDNDILGLIQRSRYSILNTALSRNGMPSHLFLPESRYEGMKPISARQAAGEYKAKPGVNFGRLNALLGAKLYGEPKDIASVSVKEMLQNSFDAIKALIDKGQILQGKIEISVDQDNRSITVTDNGTGMTPQTLATSFLQIASTEKESERSSGGLGIAKGLFLYGNERIEVETDRNGVRSRLATTGAELSAAADGTGPAPTITTGPAPDDRPGTMVKVWIPKSYIDPADGREIEIDIPGYGAYYPVLRRSPLFSNIEVTFNKVKMDNIGSTFVADDYSKFATVQGRWGVAHIYVGKQKQTDMYDDNLHFLSNGLWQFSASLRANPLDPYSKRIPRQMYMDVQPRVRPEDPGYPFDLNRQRFSPPVTKDFDQILAYLTIAHRKEAVSDIAANFGTIRYLTERGQEVRVGNQETLAPEAPPVTEAELMRVVEGDTVTIQEGQLSVNGRVVPLITKEDIQRATIDLEKFRIPQEQVRRNAVMLHDNIRLPDQGDKLFSDFMREKKGGEFDRFIFNLGKSFQSLRSWADGRPNYTLGAYGIGVSFDGSYHGVHITAPFRAAFVNPAALALDQNDEVKGNELFQTMVHELVHNVAPEHGARFVNELQLTVSEILSDPVADAIRTNLVDLVRRNSDLIDFMTRSFNRERKQPVGNSFQGEEQRRPEGPAPGREERGEGPRPERGVRYGPLESVGPLGRDEIDAGVSRPRQGVVRREIYAVRNGRLTGIAVRSRFDATWEVRYGTGADLRIRGKFRTRKARSADEARRLLSAAGDVRFLPPDDVPPHDLGILYSGGRAFDLEDTDISRLMQYAVHPRTIASFDRDFAPLVMSLEAKAEYRDQIISEIYETLRPMFKASAAVKKRVYAVLELGRLKGEIYGTGTQPVVATNTGQNAALTRRGERITLNDEEKSVYWSVRRGMDQALDFLRDEHVREHGLDPDAITEPEQVLAAIPAGAPTVIRNRLMRLARDLTDLRELRRNGYVPFSRWGAFGIYVQDRAGNTIHFEQIESIGRFFSGRKAMTRAEELREQYPDAIVSQPFYMTPARASAMVDFGLLDNLASMARLDPAQYEAVRDQLAEAQRTRGFGRHLLRAENVAGYSVDFERAIADYVVGLASYASRRRYRQQIESDIGSIPPHKSRLFQAARTTADYADSPQEEYQLLRQTNYVYYLAAVPMTAIANATQPWLTTAPILTALSNPGKASVLMGRAYIDATNMIRWMDPVALIAKPNEFFNPQRAPADVRDGLSQAWEKGILAPMTTMEMMGLARNRAEQLRKLGRYTRQSVEFLAHMFMTAERANRIVTYIAAYRLAAEPGMRSRILQMLEKNGLAMQALDTVSVAQFPAAFAEYMVDETQFRTGKVNRATLQRNIGTAIFQFKDYPWQMVELYMRMGSLGGARGKVALALMLLLLGTTAGLWGLPFADNLRKLYEFLYKGITDRDLDLRLAVRDAIVDMTDSPRLAEAASAGVFRYMDDAPDLSTRIGLGNILPNLNDPASYLGVPFDLLWKRGEKAAQWIKRDEYGMAAAAVAPNLIKNWIEAEQWKETGVRSQAYGSLIIPPEDLTAWDIWMKRMGGRTRKIAEQTESEYAQQRASHAIDDMRRAFTYRIGVNMARSIRAGEQGDTYGQASADEKIQDAWATLERHNEQRPVHEQVIINADALRRRVEAELLGPMARELRAPRATREERRRIEERYYQP